MKNKSKLLCRSLLLVMFGMLITSSVKAQEFSTSGDTELDNIRMDVRENPTNRGNFLTAIKIPWN